MKLPRSENAFRNMRVGLFTKIVSLLCPFIVRTIFIRVLGAEYLGLNSLYSSILSVLNLTELGFSSAVVFSMYKAIAENDDTTINALLYFYKKVYLCIGSIILAVGLLLIPFLHFLVKDASYPGDINPLLVYLFFLMDTVLSYFLFAYKNSIFEAFQRTDITSKINMVKEIGTNVLQIILLLLIKNYYAYLVVIPIFTIISNLLTAVKTRKMFPQFHPYGRLNKKVKAEINKKVGGLVIQKICVVSRNSFDSIFVSIYLGLKDIAIYNNYYYVISMVSSFMVIATTAITAGVGNSIVTESQEKNYKDMLKINSLYMWLAGWFMTCLFCLYQPFMKIWAGDELLLPIDSVIWFTLYFYALKVGAVVSVYSGAAGLYWQQRYRALAEASANVLLNWILGKYFGINGIICATLISLLFFNFIFGTIIVYKNYFTEQKVYKYFACQARRFIVASVICFFTYGICRVFPETYIFFVVRMVICTVIPNVLFFLIYRKTKSYQETVPWILERVGIQRAGIIWNILVGETKL